MILPEFITFTGADDQTSIEGMLALSHRYPVEFGILVSPAREGIPRYPTAEVIDCILEARGRLNLAAHVCGNAARAFIAGRFTGAEKQRLSRFRRVQVNTADTSIDPHEVDAVGAELGVRVVLQCRGERFPSDDEGPAWLFDTSGGRGETPKAWPSNRNDGILRGYAGGINPDNVRRVVDVVSYTPGRYWLDMESGVRNEHDEFDIGLCRKVCEAVYGERQP
ncbi:hypothetical protein ABXN37_19635 [Piscinibacter sakaiensis]|uniref:Phosphoribosylanthranilate isomerase n=1 Tax=Piscinibacter sakaiensis TaxID=1547922 RepID=A0A0K8P3W6_PISS1|nr:hypothetical protein [Piscinibacter sakaiensis]GAP37338.1 hypothetical protein ISF6_3193 [Piscinibacter sakaiensis]